jgi:uncharacterized membrane protein
METPNYDEKEEKEVSKHEGKSTEEKYRRDPIGAISWAILLIWAGAVLLLYNLGRTDILIDFVQRLNLPLSEWSVELPFINMQTWQIFFLGAGVIVLLEIIVRLLLPAYRRPIIGSIVWAAILFTAAFGNWVVIGPIALIVIGVAILLGRFTRRR